MMDNEALTNKKANAKAREEAELPAKGHNSDKLLQEHISFIYQRMSDIDTLRDEIKERLQDAKNEGFLKMALRKTVKELRATEEQRQSKREVNRAAEEYFNKCKDLPLFGHAHAEAA